MFSRLFDNVDRAPSRNCLSSKLETSAVQSIFSEFILNFVLRVGGLINEASVAERSPFGKYLVPNLESQESSVHLEDEDQSS